MFIPAGMIATADIFKKENITEGVEVFFTGLFTSHFGIFQNIPISRFGKIAQISKEKYWWNNSYTELFVIETAPFGGISGAPLFYSSDAIKDSVGLVSVPPTLYLTGIISGYFQNSEKQNNSIKQSFESSGLAGVVPAYKLMEILNLPSVGLERDNELKRLQKEK